jgi:hypothetical protein
VKKGGGVSTSQLILSPLPGSPHVHKVAQTGFSTVSWIDSSRLTMTSV